MNILLIMLFMSGREMKWENKSLQTLTICMLGLVRRKALVVDPGFLVDRRPLSSGKPTLHSPLFYKNNNNKTTDDIRNKLVRRVGTPYRSATECTL